jgi:TRAP-type C4-dicarboxylate transport system permease small subunit
MIQFMRKALNSCESVLTYLGIGSAVTMMCLTTGDALARYLFNSPILFTYEMTEKYLMPMALCLALSFSYRGGTFIRVTLLTDHLPKKVTLPLNYLVLIISILYAATLVVMTTKRTFKAIASGVTLATIKFPLWPAYLLIAVSLFFLTLVMLFDLPEVKRGRTYLFDEGKEDEVPLA